MTRRRTIYLSTFAVAATACLALATSKAEAETVLFADSFERADSTDLNALAAGKSGTLGTLNWVEQDSAGDSMIASNQFKFGKNGVGGGGWAVAYPDHSFTDPAISSAGGFTVSFDMVSDNSGGGTRFMGIAVGHSKTELDSPAANDPASFQSDFFIGIAPTGTDKLNIYSNGTKGTDIGFTLNLTQPLKSEVSGAFPGWAWN